MIYELGSYSLADKIELGQKLPESEVWSVIYNCASSLNWIHSCEKLHMNIKPGNIIKCRGKYKLADPLIEHDFVQNHLEDMNTLN
jgi:serine/threonine protein kinase